jgi:hydroxyethylthiazole kinase
MADAIQEVSEIPRFADGLVLNIGTLNEQKVASMLLAAQTAEESGTPIILDPVGVGSTSYRAETIQQLLNEHSVTLIRGNAGEIATLADIDWEAKGVDAGEGDASLEETAKRVAEKHQCLVALSGETDFITDGKEVIAVTNGHEMLSRITGSGCMLANTSAAFLATDTGTPLERVIAAHVAMGTAGERAATREDVQGTGTFRSALIDELSRLDDDLLLSNQKTEVIHDE